MLSIAVRIALRCSVERSSRSFLEYAVSMKRVNASGLEVFLLGNELFQHRS